MALKEGCAKSGRVWYRPADANELSAFFRQCRDCPNRLPGFTCAVGVGTQLLQQQLVNPEDQFHKLNWFSEEQLDAGAIPARCKLRGSRPPPERRDDPDQLCMFDCPLPRR